MLVLTTLAAEERRTLLARKRKPKAVPATPEPEPVATTRVTLVNAEPFAGEDEAEQWRTSVDPDAEVAEAVRTINDVLRAHRAAAADPYPRDVAREQALVVRLGVGEGEQVAEGRWTSAVTLPKERSPAAERRQSVLRPQERLAAVLSGRDVALACEELTLRGRLDLDAGRSREAALQLRVALEAAIAELAPWRDRGDVAERIDALKDERGVVGAAANAALEGGLDDATAAHVERVLKLVEAALRARTLVELGR